MIGWRSHRSAGRVRHGLRLLALACSYFVAATCGSLPAGVGGTITGLGLPAGLALAALAIFGRSLWPGVALGAALAFWAQGVTFAGALMAAAGSTLGALLPAVLMGMGRSGAEPPGVHLRDLGLLLLGSVLGPSVAVSFELLAMTLGLVPGLAPQPSVWLAGWMSQALGVITFVPFLVLAVRPPLTQACRLAEALAWCGLLALWSLQVFAHWPLPGAAPFGAGSLFPLVTVISLRCGPRTVAFSLMMVVVIDWFCAWQGWGYFGTDLAATGLRRLWFYNVALVLTGLALSIVATERRRAEGALRQAARIVESMQEGVMVTDGAGRILAVNPAFSEITGYGAAEVIGRQRGLIDAPPESVLAERDEALATAGRWQGEIWSRRKNGESYPLWQRISALRADDRSTINQVAVFSDISSLKVSREELEYLAHHDVLTDLPNRLLFRDRLDHAIQRAQRSSA
ncbi:MAG: PAS domain S-box protein, partial [Gammaproteobacteria bacterium]|nr:PAS domain S-box protein [Gammaproteobacteria bacterium]